MSSDDNGFARCRLPRFERLFVFTRGVQEVVLRTSKRDGDAFFGETKELEPCFPRGKCSCAVRGMVNRHLVVVASRRYVFVAVNNRDHGIDARARMLFCRRGNEPAVPSDWRFRSNLLRIGAVSLPARCMAE